MTKRAKNPIFTTPAGIAQYPHLNTPDTKFNADGEYKIALSLPVSEATELIAFLDQQFDEAVAKAKQENAGKRIKNSEVPYLVDENTGTVTVKFKLKAKVTPKVGEPFTQRPALFDAKGKPLSADTRVGGGSKVKVAYEVIPFFTAIAGAGISLRLKAVQVIDLRQFSGGASASGFGFGEEDGYEAATETAAAEANGFANEEDVDETADF